MILGVHFSVSLRMFKTGRHIRPCPHQKLHKEITTSRDPPIDYHDTLGDLVQTITVDSHFTISPSPPSWKASLPPGVPGCGLWRRRNYLGDREAFRLKLSEEHIGISCSLSPSPSAKVYNVIVSWDFNIQRVHPFMILSRRNLVILTHLLATPVLGLWIEHSTPNFDRCTNQKCTF